MTRAEKFEEVFGFKIDTSADCGFFDCSDVPDCKGCEFGEKKYKEWWEAEYIDKYNAEIEPQKSEE